MLESIYRHYSPFPFWNNPLWIESIPDQIQKFMKYRLPNSHWTQLHISSSVVAFWVFNKSLGCYSVFLWTRPRIVWNEWIYSAETRARPQDRVKMISLSSITFKTHLQTQGSDFRPSSSVFLLKIPPVRFLFALVRKEGRGKKKLLPQSLLRSSVLSKSKLTKTFKCGSQSSV